MKRPIPRFCYSFEFFTNKPTSKWKQCTISLYALSHLPTNLKYLCWKSVTVKPWLITNLKHRWTASYFYVAIFKCYSVVVALLGVQMWWQIGMHDFGRSQFNKKKKKLYDLKRTTIRPARMSSYDFNTESIGLTILTSLCYRLFICSVFTRRSLSVINIRFLSKR